MHGLKQITVLIGISGSGKTTMRKQLQEGSYADDAVYSLDEMRREFFTRRHGREPVANEAQHLCDNNKEFDMMCKDRWNNLVASGVNIISDNTNLTTNIRYKYLEAARVHGYTLRAIVLNTPFKTCWERQQARGDDGTPYYRLEAQREALRVATLTKDFHSVSYLPDDKGLEPVPAGDRAPVTFDLYDPAQLKVWVETHPKLVKVGLSKRYPDLRILKYSQRCNFENLWDYAAIEMRGLVVNEDWNVIVHPFTKMNYESAALGSVPATTFKEEELLLVTRKYNGFMGAVTNTRKYGPIYSTTGSLDSNYCDMLRENFPEEKARNLPMGHTFMFEICDSRDPHVIPERLGAQPLAFRDRTSHCMFLDATHEGHLWTASQLRFNLKTCRHEGYVACNYDAHRKETARLPLVKFKSNYYSIVKAVGRCNADNFARMVNDIKAMAYKFGPELMSVYEAIRDNQQSLKALPELERMQQLRNILDAHPVYAQGVIHE